MVLPTSDCQWGLRVSIYVAHLPHGGQRLTKASKWAVGIPIEVGEEGKLKDGGPLVSYGADSSHRKGCNWQQRHLPDKRGDGTAHTQRVWPVSNQEMLVLASSGFWQPDQRPLMTKKWGETATFIQDLEDMHFYVPN